MHKISPVFLFDDRSVGATSREVLSQHQSDARAEIEKISTAAQELSRITAEANLQALAQQLIEMATAMKQGADAWIATDLQEWIRKHRRQKI